MLKLKALQIQPSKQPECGLFECTAAPRHVSLLSEYERELMPVCNCLAWGYALGYPGIIPAPSISQAVPVVLVRLNRDQVISVIQFIKQRKLTISYQTNQTNNYSNIS